METARAIASLPGLGRVLDVLLPPQCLACGTLVEASGVEAPGALCADCWPRLAFIAGPHCARCGLPFEYAVGDGAVCGSCHRTPPAFERARAVLAYDDASRPLVLAFKHGDRTDTAPTLARWMARAGAALLAEADCVAPVPLHWTRLAARRFNQAALLSRALARQAGPTHLPDLLERRRRTPSQGGLGRRQRRENLRGAFRVRPRMRRRVAGARVLLVDDVLTTGATAEACARVLRRAGAASVDVLTLARVVRSAF